MHILMVAAENDALPGGKVGGLGDVIRDLPIALAQAGHRVTVVTPGYGVFADPNRATAHPDIRTPFASALESVRSFTVTAPKPVPNVTHWVLEHPLFSAWGAGRIYVSEGDGPFAADAQKFALFCAAVARGLVQGAFGAVDRVHAHDWHTGLLLVLRRFDPTYAALQRIPSVFSIHNLAMQGIRPFAHGDASFSHWFPHLAVDPALLADPRYGDCINPLRAAINLADRVHTVSPTYAREILRPSDPDRGIVGGEGLELDLRRVHEAGRLIGILNGCDYSVMPPAAVAAAELWPQIELSLQDWLRRDRAPNAGHLLACKQLRLLRRRRVSGHPLLVSVGRLTAQKVFLLTLPHGEGTVMDTLLKRLGSGSFILMGSGDPHYDHFFSQRMVHHDNFLFLGGYSDSLAATLYSSGDLFVMPSSFEPCGISQMLAMRAGVPCLVHGVGGLLDTVRHGVNGFVFEGDTLTGQAQALLTTLNQALALYKGDPTRWSLVRAAARETRFSWESVVQDYLQHLYIPTHD